MMKLYCDRCDKDLHDGETVYDFGYMVLCANCKDKYLEELEEDAERIVREDEFCNEY